MTQQTQEVVATDQAQAPAAVSVTTTATQLVASRAARVSVLVINNGASTLYWGKDATVTSTTGVPLASGAGFEERDYTGAIYAVTATGTADARVWDVG